MGVLAQEGGSAVPGGAVAGVAFLLAALTGMVTAVTALIKVFRDRREPDDPAAPRHSETIDEAQTRILRETIEQLGDALDRVADAEADAAQWRDRYIRLLEGERDL